MSRPRFSQDIRSLPAASAKVAEYSHDISENRGAYYSSKGNSTNARRVIGCVGISLTAKFETSLPLVLGTESFDARLNDSSSHRLSYHALVWGLDAQRLALLIPVSSKENLELMRLM